MTPNRVCLLMTRNASYILIWIIKWSGLSEDTYMTYKTKVHTRQGWPEKELWLWLQRQLLTSQKNSSYLSDTAEDALPRLGVCWSGTDWFDSFRALLLRSGLESVCDKSLRDPWEPEACREFWEPNLPLRTGMDGTAKPLWSVVFDWSAPL